MRTRLRPLAVLIAFHVSALAACFSDNGGAVGIEGVDCDTTVPPTNTAIVRIRNFAFEPATLTVVAGTRVVWINCESQSSAALAHTTTSETGLWTSALLFGQGAGEFARVFPQAGTFPYFCQPHPAMQASIVVQ